MTENVNERTENQCSTFLLLYCYTIRSFTHVLNLVSLRFSSFSVRQNKKVPATVALVQILHLELLSNVYVKKILIDNTT